MLNIWKKIREAVDSYESERDNTINDRPQSGPITWQDLTPPEDVQIINGRLQPEPRGTIYGFKVAVQEGEKYRSLYPVSPMTYSIGHIYHDEARPNHGGGLYIHNVRSVEETIRAFEEGNITQCVSPRHYYAILEVAGWGTMLYYDENGRYLTEQPQCGTKKVAVSYMAVLSHAHTFTKQQVTTAVVGANELTVHGGGRKPPLWAPPVPNRQKSGLWASIAAEAERHARQTTALFPLSEEEKERLLNGRWIPNNQLGQAPRFVTSVRFGVELAKGKDYTGYFVSNDV